MAKIIKNPNGFKTAVCQCCGCEYEYEKGDTITNQFMRFNHDTRKVKMLLECPICATYNSIFEGFINDKEQNNETN